MKDIKRDLIYEVMDCFDFDRVVKVMNFLDWKWGGTDDTGIQIWEVRKSARERLSDAYDLSIKENQPFISCYVSSGGLKATARLYPPDGENDTHDIELRLEFILTSWDETAPYK